MQVDGITWNPAEAAQAGTVCRKVIQCDLEKGIPDVAPHSYDAVICSHILEHIAYPQSLIADIWKALRPGAVLIVVIPNLFFWPDRIKLFRGIWNYQTSGTFDYTHLRWYTSVTMSDLLTSSGFTVSQFKAFGWVPLPGLRRVLTTSARNWLNQKACRMFPGLFGQQLLYCATKPTQH
jgi:SAM-dependent methyltransferase